MQFAWPDCGGPREKIPNSFVGENFNAEITNI